MPDSDPNLAARYDALHDSSVQRGFRRLAPMPMGVVFLQSPGMSADDMRAHFRQMRALGFNALKQIMTCPGTTIAEVQHLALDEGIIPWWYGEGGWEPITNALLARLGIAADAPMAEIRQHPAMRAYQTQFLRDRIDRQGARATDAPPSAPLDFVHSSGFEIAPAEHPRFVAWLRAQYVTVAALAEAWNLCHVGIAPGGVIWQTWDEVAASWHKLGAHEYRHGRDLLRYKADRAVEALRARAAESLAREPVEPLRAGGEMGLFLPFASRATDMEGIADAMTEVGSFYPSIHLAWHFEEVNFEMPRTIYMQASLGADWFKGGWSATWESTGGPQQLSGGKGWEPAGAAQTAGFTVDGGAMTQLLLSYLAAGFRGVGLWCWNARTAGWEAGEYALLDRNGQLTERAACAGAIARACERHRDELWESRKEPLVGVFCDWDSEAIWACVAVPNRDHYKHTPIKARVGISRALIGGNIPFEYVTARDLRAGLAARYPAIYLPATLALAADLLPVFREYVAGGGRLVLDMPGAWYDTFGRLLPTETGSAFEQLFGATLDDFQYARNVPRTAEGIALNGFVADLTPTTASVLSSFDSGRAAVTENRLGTGTAVLIGYDGALRCHAPGRTGEEETLRRFVLGTELTPPIDCAAVIYRRHAPAADHYFLVNDAPARRVMLRIADRAYVSCEDAVTGEELPVGADGMAVALEAYSGRWLRFGKTQ